VSPRLIACHYCESELHNWEERSTLVCDDCYDHHLRVVAQYQSWARKQRQMRDMSKRTPVTAVTDGLRYDRI
jgi:hypothetical protein